MMADRGKQDIAPERLLTMEQEGILEQYIIALDNYYEALQASEKLQIEIETEHLKKVLDI